MDSRSLRFITPFFRLPQINQLNLKKNKSIKSGFRLQIEGKHLKIQRFTLNLSMIMKILCYQEKPNLYCLIINSDASSIANYFHPKPSPLLVNGFA